MMSGIHGKHTKPEILVRHGLHARGFRYRLHAKNLPGRPDLIFQKWKAIIFVHGCFWHAHDCKFFKIPATRTDFWLDKIRSNKERDKRQLSELHELGWRTLTVWECVTRKNTEISHEQLFDLIAEWLKNGNDCSEIDLGGIHA